MHPKVSVIIPTYKRSDMLKRAIDSVLAQSYDNIEIIVIDDNNPSTNFRQITESRMQEYEGIKNVIYLKHEKNKNGSAARNTGIKASTGDFVTFLDDDDYYYKDKVSKEVEYLEKYANFDAVYCWREDKFGKTCGKYDGNLTELMLLNKFMPGTPTLMFRRKVFSEIGLFDENFMRHQEVEFLLRYFRTHSIGHVEYMGVFVDVEDRQNEIHGKKLEVNKENYLAVFSNDIDEIFKSDSKKGKMIYVEHYIDVVCDHIQHGYINRAIHYFIKSMKVNTLLTFTEFFSHAMEYAKIKLINKKGT